MSAAHRSEESDDESIKGLTKELVADINSKENKSETRPNSKQSEINR